MVTDLVTYTVDNEEKEPAIDAPRPRREPKPSKKKLAGLDNDSQCEDPKRKHARKESRTEKAKDCEELVDKEPVISDKKKHTSKKRKAVDSKNDNDSEIILVSNTNRVQNLLERRKHASCRSNEVVEVEEVAEVHANKINLPSGSVQLNPQPTADPVQIISKPQLQPTDAVKSRDSNLRNQPVDTFQQRYTGNIYNKITQLTANEQNREGTFFPPQQSSPSPVTPASRFQFSSPSMGSSHTVSTSPSLSHSSKSSPPQVLSPPDIPQQEFSISRSLSHCSYYNVPEWEVPMGYPSRNTNLHQLQTGRGHIQKDDSWQGMPPLSDLINPCPNCQPLLQSLSSRLNNLEAEVEKLRRKQRKLRSFIIINHNSLCSRRMKIISMGARKNGGYDTLFFLAPILLFSCACYAG